MSTSACRVWRYLAACYRTSVQSVLDRGRKYIPCYIIHFSAVVGYQNNLLLEKEQSGPLLAVFWDTHTIVPAVSTLMVIIASAVEILVRNKETITNN